MKDYLLVIRGDSTVPPLEGDEQERHVEKWYRWLGELRQAGVFRAGEPLAPVGKVLRGRRKYLTDGPFAETKEVVGGYLIVAADSEAAAVDLARGCPAFETGGSVEVREILPMDAERLERSV